MKNKKYTKTLLIVTVVLYAIISFVDWDICWVIDFVSFLKNIHFMGRFMFLLLMFIYFLLPIILIDFIEKNRNRKDYFEH
mgnify:CR=1 FL=1|tara:strand:+ start:561 stop:800 length:240 start_codon:yes stop_codon:yes gene_type:complete